MEDMHRILEAAAAAGELPIALAVIIHVEGSSYKKEGAAMLLMANGERIGTLTAGCLEEDLAIRAKAVHAEGKSSAVQYDLSSEDDLSWGQGAGCNGVITILLEPITKELRQHLLLLKENLDKGKAVVRIIRLTDSFDLKGEVYIAEDGTKFGSSNFPFTLEVDRKDPILLNETEGGPDLFFVHPIFPVPRLYVFGAGEDARPLVSLAARTGFKVLIVDWRPALCSPEHFPEAAGWIVGKAEEVLDKIIFSKRDFAVIMTHQFEKDRMILARMMDAPLSYIGVLGPARRTERLLGGRTAPEAVHSPAGLPIGAKGPEEIAVSIVGEMIRKLRGRP
ncbi:XdhC/CoxI family protein [Bacillus infantis]|uniref:XdhC family protein n=1 Tax=Bacillus infantis TaxID=324767 RepID=UPI000B9C0977|nr:XdhC/CoxI family protein [Bacillus infantis]MCK6206826.1 XdhC/CoxI family protein [Bacillus infantis]OXT18007.1 xanthine dehydrogenase [Bacillus sp. OG2]